MKTKQSREKKSITVHTTIREDTVRITGGKNYRSITIEIRNEETASL